MVGTVAVRDRDAGEGLLDHGHRRGAVAADRRVVVLHVAGDDAVEGRQMELVHLAEADGAIDDGALAALADQAFADTRTCHAVGQRVAAMGRASTRDRWVPYV